MVRMTRELGEMGEMGEKTGAEQKYLLALSSSAVQWGCCADQHR
jgi:hypothetical protein